MFIKNLINDFDNMKETLSTGLLLSQACPGKNVVSLADHLGMTTAGTYKHEPSERKL